MFERVDILQCRRVEILWETVNIASDQNLRTVVMAVQANGDLFGRQGSISIKQNFPTLHMAAQAVSARRLCGREMQKIVEARFISIHHDLRSRLNSSLEGVGHQLTRTALNDEEHPAGTRLRASSDVAQESSPDSPRQGSLRGNELPIGSTNRNSDIEGRLQSHVGTRSSQGTASPQEIEDREGGNLLMPSARPTNEVIAVLKNRQQQDIIIDSYTFVEVLKRCSEQKDLIAARQVHDCILQSAMDKNPYVATALLNVYIRCGRLGDARRVFDGLEKKNDVSWRIMVAGYAKNDHAEDALEVFNRMRQAGAQPDQLTCLSILKACASPLALKWGKEIHAYIKYARFESDVRVGTALVQMYAKCKSLTEARQVFEKLANRNVVTWNVMIRAFAENGNGLESYRLFLQMKREGFKPDAVTYVSILNPSASKGALEWVKEVHGHALRAGLESNLRVGNAFVHMYRNSGSIQDARLVFDGMEERDLITWNMMIGAYAESGSGVKAYRLFLEMKREGFKPDAFTYVSILNPSARAGALKWVKEVHSHALGAGLESNVRVGNGLVHMYAKSGSIEDARLVFDRMGKHDLITWNIIIGAYAESGSGVEAYRLFLQMKREGFEPDAFTYVSILNPSAGAGALEWVKEIHSHASRARLESNLRVANALVHMYAKSGSIDDARLLFDRMEKRDTITWNMMIGAYSESGCGVDAYRLFLQMKREGFKPDAITFVTVLNAFGSEGALEWVKEVHSHAVEAGLESDLRVGSALVNTYAKSGSTEDGRLVFDRMEKRDIVTWTMMIGAYAKSGCGVEAYRLFLQMEREGFKPDELTYVSILNPSTSAGALEWVKEVYTHALRAGRESNLRVGNAFVHMYAKSGSIQDARLVFDGMEKRDLITWNMMVGAYAESGSGVEAYRLLLQMKREGFEPDAFTYSSILNAIASAGALEWVTEIHGHVRTAGLESDLRVGNALLHMYVKSGSLDDARLVFDRMEKRDLITWNMMIGAYAENGSGVDAYRLFLQMKREGFKPDAITFVTILNPSASAGALEWVREVHSHAVEGGLESDLRVGNALVHMYAKSGSIEYARLVFDGMEKRDLITWNIIIGAYAESGCGVEAYRLFLQMKREDFEPDAFTYVSILNRSVSAGALEWVKEVHSHILRGGLKSDVRVGSVLVDMYAKCGSIDDARLVFDRMEQRDVITWTIMIGAYAESGCGVEAYKLFLQMKREGLEPDACTYVSILNPSSSAGALEWVKDVHSHALRAGLESNSRVGNGLVHMYAKSGSIEDARLVFDRMEKRDVFTWTTMIGGLAQHGCGHEALELFRKMNGECVIPDGITFVSVLSACCHAGLVDDGRRLFLSMTQDHGIEPTVVHYNCMVDLLGRAGHLEEAKLLIGDMPLEPNAVTWGALLGACRIYDNVELGELAAKEVLKLEPKDAGAYVALSNIYAAAGKWEQVSLMRTMMQDRGVRKEPGRSWIEVDNKIHDFVVGDTAHPEARAIYAELNELSKALKAEGYIPDTLLVLQNIGEEDKELALCSHSEKLAIVYGLMHTPVGKPIRVYKNLRVCSDCHRATKFISKVTGREIIARDSNRFHHFKDGVCSCGDYW